MLLDIPSTFMQSNGQPYVPENYDRLFHGPVSLRQALASHRAAGNRNRQAVTLRSLAQAQAQAGEPGPACESWSAAAAIFDDLGNSVQAAEVRAEQDASGVC